MHFERLIKFWNEEPLLVTEIKYLIDEVSRCSIKRPLDSHYDCAMLIAQYIDGRT